ncbi:dctR protein, partial [Escherichia coli]|nr:dctR protein [Escherichia coli]
MYYIKLIYSKLTIIISPVLLITFGKLIIKLMSAPGVGYVSYNYQGYDVLHR